MSYLVFHVQFPGSNIVSIFHPSPALEADGKRAGPASEKILDKKKNPTQTIEPLLLPYLEPAPRTLGTDLPGYCFC